MEVLKTSILQVADQRVRVAIISAAMAGAREGKKHLIASAIEHACVIRTLEYLSLVDFTYTLIPVDDQGLLRLEQLEKAITNETRLAGHVS